MRARISHTFASKYCPTSGEQHNQSIKHICFRHYDKYRISDSKANMIKRVFRRGENACLAMLKNHHIFIIEISVSSRRNAYKVDVSPRRNQHFRYNDQPLKGPPHTPAPLFFIGKMANLSETIVFFSFRPSTNLIIFASGSRVRRVWVCALEAGPAFATALATAPKLKLRFRAVRASHGYG